MFYRRISLFASRIQCESLLTVPCSSVSSSPPDDDPTTLRAFSIPLDSHQIPMFAGQHISKWFGMLINITYLMATSYVTISDSGVTSSIYWEDFLEMRVLVASLIELLWNCNINGDSKSWFQPRRCFTSICNIESINRRVFTEIFW